VQRAVAPIEYAPTTRRVGPPPVPHINQSWPAGAPSTYVDVGYCGPTSMAMVARAYGLGASLTDAELVLRLGRIADTPLNRGTDRFGLFRMASHLRLKSRDWDGQATHWMARHLELGHYVLAAGNPFVLPPFEKLAGYGEHFIVVDGMDHDGNFLMKNPWPDGVHTVAPRKMHQFLMTSIRGYQYAFWR
jgi:Peptidase_C39 like family